MCVCLCVCVCVCVHIHVCMILNCTDLAVTLTECKTYFLV